MYKRARSSGKEILNDGPPNKISKHDKYASVNTFRAQSAHIREEALLDSDSDVNSIECDSSDVEALLEEPPPPRPQPQSPHKPLKNAFFNGAKLSDKSSRSSTKSELKVSNGSIHHVNGHRSNPVQNHLTMVKCDSPMKAVTCSNAHENRDKNEANHQKHSRNSNCVSSELKTAKHNNTNGFTCRSAKADNGFKQSSVDKDCSDTVNICCISVF